MAKVKCPRCSHELEYTGKAWWITCPVCRKMIKNMGVHKNGR